MVHQTIDMQRWRFLCVMMAAIALGGCYYDVEEELYPVECITDNVTYRGTVLPVIQRECYTCHDALTQEGGINLDGYDNFYEWVANGKVLASIRHESAFPMPQDAEKLDSCIIAKIETWILAGALNN